MRVLAACFTLVLALAGLATLAACSDVSDGTAGAGGAGGSGGNASAGAPSGGSGGGTADCKYMSSNCQTCITQMCSAQVAACGADSTTCLPALNTLTVCACDTKQTPDDCQAAFLKTGSLAERLTNCYSLNCLSACQ
jgi:hypothetical protein